MLVESDRVDGRPAEAGSLRDEIIRAGALWSHSQHHLVRLAAALELSREWEVDESPTCAHWIADAIDIEVSTAREWLRIGRALAELDVVDAAFVEGRLSYSKVRTLTRVATPESAEELCLLAQRVPAGRLRCALAAWQQRRETPEETEARQHTARGLGWAVDVDGMIAGWFRLAPAGGANAITAIDALVQQATGDASADAFNTGRWPSVAQQRADALVALARGATAPTAEIILHVRGDGCSLDDGTPIPDSVVERIAPDAFLRALIHNAEGKPVNASAKRRHPTARQQRVVRARDARCVDCGATDLLQYDHDPPYEQSRHTVTTELQLRCWKCHHRRHNRPSVLEKARDDVDDDGKDHSSEQE